MASPYPMSGPRCAIARRRTLLEPIDVSAPDPAKRTAAGAATPAEPPPGPCRRTSDTAARCRRSASGRIGRRARQRTCSHSMTIAECNGGTQPRPPLAPTPRGCGRVVPAGLGRRSRPVRIAAPQNAARSPHGYEHHDVARGLLDHPDIAAVARAPGDRCPRIHPSTDQLQPLDRGNESQVAYRGPHSVSYDRSTTSSTGVVVVARRKVREQPLDQCTRWSCTAAGPYAHQLEHLCGRGTNPRAQCFSYAEQVTRTRVIAAQRRHGHAAPRQRPDEAEPPSRVAR
jgi:hypothetical protein